jgi:cytochrome P450
MITSGEPWRKNRRLMQPLFNPGPISNLFPMMNRVIEEMIEDFSVREAKGEILEIRSEMMWVTLRIIGETIMGTDVTRHVDTIGKALADILQYIADNYVSIINLPLFIPTPRNRKYLRAIKALNEIVYEVIKKRRQSQGNPDDLLARLMEARNEENGGALTDSEIRDEIMTMFLAGHETTANTLAWTWYLLAQNPESEQRMYHEVTSQLKNWPPTKDDLKHLGYTTQVMEEALRLYPPVWAVSRSTIQDDEIGGYHIPAKSTVFFSPYALHRKPGYWQDPEKFDPERFSPQNKPKIQPFTYLPFIEGPRKCLGYHFAMIESPLVMAAVVRKFRLRLVPTHPVALNFTVTLRPKNGIKMVLEKR